MKHWEGTVLCLLGHLAQYFREFADIASRCLRVGIGLAELLLLIRSLEFDGLARRCGQTSNCEDYFHFN